MRIDIITIFPDLFDPFINESLLKKARQKKLLDIRVHDLRDFTKDARRTVDDRPFGGGLGMVIKAEPFYKAVQKIKLKNKKARVVLFSPRGKEFRQPVAAKYAKLDQLILLCGRYEGVDERVAKYIAEEEISIGEYVLMGGEVPAMAVVETVSRLIPGVVGKDEFLKEHVTKKKGFLEYPEYTRPEEMEINGKKRKVPKVLLSGNHKEIADWKKKYGKSVGA